MSAALVLSTTMQAMEQQSSRKSMSFSTNMQHVPEETFVLSLDGGGIRGVIQLKILAYLQKKIEAKQEAYVRYLINKTTGRSLSSNAPIPIKAHMARFFKYMAGTSTGGIVSLGLNRATEECPDIPKYDANDLMQLYKKHGDKVFPGNEQRGLIGNLFAPKFGVQGLEEVLKDYFANAQLKDTVSNVLVTAYEMRREELYQFESVKARLSDDDNFPDVNVARSTSAAPTIFPSAKINDGKNDQRLFADGGIVANNPSQLALIAAQKLFPKTKIVMLSLGTGQCRHDNLSSINQGLQGWGTVMPFVMMDAASKMTDWLVQQMAQSSPETFEYHRFQVDLSKERSELDKATEDNINYLLAIADNFIEKHDKELISFANRLALMYKNYPYPIYPAVITALKNQLAKKEASIVLSDRSLAEVGGWEIAQYLKVQSPQILTNITALDLSNNALKDEGLRFLSDAMPSLQKLTFLSLQNNQITSDGMQEIYCIPKTVAYLCVSENSIADKGIMHIVKALPLLQGLDVSSVGMSNRGLEEIAHLNSLQLLDIGNKNNSNNAHENTFNARNIERVVQLPVLVKLYMSGLKKNNVISGLIQGLKNKQKVTVLDVSDVGLNDEQCKMLVPALLGKRIENLDLSRNNITNPCNLLPLCSDNSSLEILNISNNSLAAKEQNAFKVVVCNNNKLKVIESEPKLSYIGSLYKFMKERYNLN